MKRVITIALIFAATNAWSLGLWLEPHVGYSVGKLKQQYSINGGFYSDNTASSQRTIDSQNNGVDFGAKIGAFQKLIPGVFAVSLGAYVSLSTMGATPDAVLYSANAAFEPISRLGAFVNFDIPFVSVWGAYMPLTSVGLKDVQGLGTGGSIAFEGTGFAVGIAYAVFKGLRINLTYQGEVYTKGKGLASVNTSNSGELKTLPAVTTNSSITRRYDELSAYRIGLSVSYALVLFD